MHLDFIDVDEAVWLFAPPSRRVAPDGPGSEAWARYWALRVWAGTPSGPAAWDRTRRLLRNVATRDYPPERTNWALKYVHLPEPDGLPVPAMVSFLPPEGPRETTLRALVRGRDHSGIDPPTIEEIPTPAGPALRGLTHQSAQDSDGRTGLYTTLAYAWRTHDPQQDDSVLDVLLWASYTPERIITMAEDLDALARSLTWVAGH
jgi:hypothetical protein